MSATTTAPPVRRSPLEHVHARLGADWVGDDARWPRAYGDAEAERAAAAERVGLADIGPIDIFVIRGGRTVDALSSMGITDQPRRVVGGNDGVEVWCLADDEAMVLRPGSADPTATAEAAAALRASGASVTDQTSGMSVLRLVGPAAPALLAEVCAVDLSPSALATEAIAQVPLAGVRVSMARQDHVDAIGYTLLVMRDQAEYVWDTLMTLGATHGIAPVGGDEASAR